MLRTWNPATRALEEGAVAPGARWVHASNPSAEERALLLRTFAVPAEFLDHALDPDELPRLDAHPSGARLVMARAPWSRREGDGDVRAISVAVLITDDAVLTVSAAEGVIERLDALHALDPASPTRFVLRLLERVAWRFLADLREIDRRVDALEERLEVSQRNEEVLGLLRYQKGLVHFETALSADRIMLERLQRDARFHKTPDDEALLEDVLVEFRQAGEMAVIATNILSETMDAFASIISNNLNVVMKVLTSLTMLASVPTLVASIYGMNVALPLQHHPGAFAIVAGVSLAVVAALGGYFRRKGWM